MIVIKIAIVILVKKFQPNFKKKGNEINNNNEGITNQKILEDNSMIF